MHGKERTESPQSIRLLGFALLAVIGCVAYWSYRTLSEARLVAVRSYLGSICVAIGDFKEQHGRYPDSLSQLDATGMDADLGIPLSSLEYESDGDAIRVVHRPEYGASVDCECPLPRVVIADGVEKPVEAVAPPTGINPNR